MKGTMTTKEIAQAIGVSEQAIVYRAKNVLDKEFSHGVTARYTADECRAILDAIKKDPANRLTEEQIAKIRSIEVELDSYQVEPKSTLEIMDTSSVPTYKPLPGEPTANPLKPKFKVTDAEELGLAIELRQYVDAVSTYIQAKRKLNKVRKELKLL